jgi:hypothetical protein
VQAFQDCNDEIYKNYTVQREASIWIYNIFRGYSPRYRMLHYSGDTDGAVATIGTRQWIASQNWNVTKEWAPWTTDGDLSGYIQEYGSFTFATIHGVGHEAAQYKRREVTELITKFIHNEPIIN